MIKNFNRIHPTYLHLFEAYWLITLINLINSINLINGKETRPTSVVALMKLHFKNCI